jgi:3D (Asp-Asp-Asp) domain-containing protein
MTERASKQQEVQSMAASTSSDINSYVSQISASQEEAQQLMADISNADSSITALVQQAEAEKAAEEKRQAEAAAEAKRQAEAEAAAEAETAQDTEESDADSSSGSEDTAADDYGYDPDEDTTESSSSSTSSEVVVEEEDEEDDVQSGNSSDYSDESFEDTSSEDTSSDTADTSSDSGSSSQGTYLGNFTLTAYCNCAQCCGTAGNLTASGTVPTAGRTVAMAGVPFGTKLLINGNVYTVEDLGTPYGHVDIYCGSHEEALSFGLQSADVYQVG